MLAARCARTSTSASSPNRFPSYVLRYSKPALKVRRCAVMSDFIRDTYISQTLPRPYQENRAPTSSCDSKPKLTLIPCENCLPMRLCQQSQTVLPHRKYHRRCLQTRSQRRCPIWSVIYLKCTRYIDLSVHSSKAQALCPWKLVLLARHGGLSSTTSRSFASSRTSSQKYAPILHVKTSGRLHVIFRYTLTLRWPGASYLYL